MTTYVICANYCKEICYRYGVTKTGSSLVLLRLESVWSRSGLGMESEWNKPSPCPVPALYLCKG
jgi:hypothetical protein